METKDRIQQIITDKHLSVRAFAIEIGAHPATFDKQLKGVNSVSLDTIQGILGRFPDISPLWLVIGEGTMYDSSGPHGNIVPLVRDVRAAGGNLIEALSSAEATDLIISPYKEATACIQVSGNSMAPDYPAGCYVFIQRIDMESYIAWGEVYVVDAVNGIVIKKVLRNDDPTKITCASLNPSEEYAPFDIPLQGIRSMWRVIGVLTTK